MFQGIKLTTYPVTDVTKATALFKAMLGADPYVESPYYVGFRTGGHEIGLVPNGRAQGMTGPISYWDVADIKQAMKTYLEAGATAVQEIKEVGGGKRIAAVKDLDGNVIWLAQ